MTVHYGTWLTNSSNRIFWLCTLFMRKRMSCPFIPQWKLFHFFILSFCVCVGGGWRGANESFLLRPQNLLVRYWWNMKYEIFLKVFNRLKLFFFCIFPNFIFSKSTWRIWKKLKNFRLKIDLIFAINYSLKKSCMSRDYALVFYIWYDISNIRRCCWGNF